MKADKTLAHDVVTSSLEYGDTLLYGQPSTLMERLQTVKNSVGGLVTRTHIIII